MLTNEQLSYSATLRGTLEALQRDLQPYLDESIFLINEYGRVSVKFDIHTEAVLIESAKQMTDLITQLQDAAETFKQAATRRIDDHERPASQRKAFRKAGMLGFAKKKVPVTRQLFRNQFP